MDDWKFPFRDRCPAPTPYFHSTKPNFYDKSGTPKLGLQVTDRFENLRARPRQKCIHCGKILRQSETAKTQLFFWQCFRSGPFALIHGLPLVCLARNSTGSYVQSTRSCGYAELVIWSSFSGPRPPMFGSDGQAFSASPERRIWSKRSQNA